MSQREFSIVIEPDEDSEYHAYCLELEGVYGQGTTVEETLSDIDAAINLALEAYQRKGWSIPLKKVVRLRKNVQTESVTT